MNTRTLHIIKLVVELGECLVEEYVLNSFILLVAGGLTD